MNEAKQKVLVIDDNAVDSEVACKALLQAGYEVYAAENGKQGLVRAKADAQSLVAIVLDRRMPVMDGNETLKEIRADGGLRHIPVIMLTGDDDVSCVMESLSLGAQDYLVKPFLPDDLIVRLRMILSGGDVRKKNKGIIQS